MTRSTLVRTLALGAVTGMRSMAGAAALASTGGGRLRLGTALLAAGEMMADKAPAVGDRIDPLPLGGRAIMGAVVGGAIAREEGADLATGVIIGAAAAVAATYAAYHLRKRLAGGSAIGGVLEDALVIAIGARFAPGSRLASASIR